jgi:hypothetical protein
MERRADAGGSLNTTKDASKTWQAVRRALGRLVSRVGVRGVEDADRTIPAAVLRGDLSLPPPRLGHDTGWKPLAHVCLASVPSAGTGLRESDLVPTVSLAQGDYALSPPETHTMPIAGLELRVDKPALEWPVEVVPLPDAFVRLPTAPVRTQSVPLPPLPKTAPLRGWAVQTLPTHVLRLPRFADPRVRWGGDTVLRRMPLTRRGKAFGEAAAEQRRLAETVHLRPEEITLLGIYPDVPILAVERIVVEDEGRQLRLWLKPEVLRSRSASHRITLLVGRQISTGKMLQAAL